MIKRDRNEGNEFSMSESNCLIDLVGKSKMCKSN